MLRDHRKQGGTAYGEINDNDNPQTTLIRDLGLVLHYSFYNLEDIESRYT